MEELSASVAAAHAHASELHSAHAAELGAVTQQVIKSPLKRGSGVTFA